MLVEIAILLWMLKLDKANHRLYREFFLERTRWYSARGKRKTPVTLHGGDTPNELVLLAGEVDGEQPPDELPGANGGEQ
jgi:hypothetical protein